MRLFQVRYFGSFKGLQATFDLLLAVFAWASPAQESPPAAEAPASEAEEAEELETELETVTVTGSGLTRASNSITPQDLEHQAAGVIPQTLLNSLPGVNVQLSDPYGLYEFGTSVRVRGFTSEQLAITLDGVPLEETPDTRDSTPPNRYIDTENLSEISVAQGSGDVTAPSFHALGGSIRYYTSEPIGSWRTLLSGTAGDDQMSRVFTRLDTAPLWDGGPIASFSGSRLSAVQWQNDFASMRTEHAQANVKQMFGAGSLTFSYKYGNRDDHDLGAVTIDGTPTFFLTRNITGDPNIDALFYDNWLNGRKDQLYSLHGNFLLTDSLRLDFVPYYEHKDGYGTAGVPPGPAQNLYDNAIAGSPDRTDIAPPAPGRFTKRIEDMGGDRSGVTAGLTWTVGMHEFQVGGWMQDYHFRQVRPLYNLDDQGNFDFASPPVTVYYDRDIQTDVQQFYIKDRVTLLDDRLIVEVGSKGLRVERQAKGYLNTSDFNTQSYLDRSKTDTDNFQPQVGFNYRLTPSEELFANYAENFSATPRLAFMAPSFNADLTPEESTNIDLGVRTSRRGFGGSITAYYIDYKDRVLSLASGDPYRVGEGTYENVGDIETYGAELAAYWKPSKSWRVGSTLSLNSSTFQDDYVVGELDADGNPITRVVPVSGEEVTDTPKFMYTLDSTYQWKQFFIGGDAKYTGARSSATTGTEEVDAYTVVNLNAGFKGTEGLMEGLAVRLNVYNLLDEKYFANISPDETSGEFVVGAPRSVYLTVSAEL